MRRVVLAGFGLALVVIGASAAPAWAGSSLPEIRVLSNRADLVSGGDALVQIVPPDGHRCRRAEGRRRRARRHLGVRGARRRPLPGRRRQPAQRRQRGHRDRGPGGTARLTITNHPIGGPVISGPQIQPWTCFDGATDAQCNRPVEYEFLYKPTSGGDAASLRPRRPPPDVATTTTDQGKTVPFIVRQETGDDRARPVPDRGALRPEASRSPRPIRRTASTTSW